MDTNYYIVLTRSKHTHVHGATPHVFPQGAVLDLAGHPKSTQPRCDARIPRSTPKKTRWAYNGTRCLDKRPNKYIRQLGCRDQSADCTC